MTQIEKELAEQEESPQGVQPPLNRRLPLYRQRSPKTSAKPSQSTGSSRLPTHPRASDPLLVHCFGGFSR